MPITWTTLDIPGDVKISISRSGGRADTFEVIADITPNDGQFDWTVTGPTSVNCALKIEPISDPSKGNVQSLFRIGDILVNPAGLTVQEPDGSAAFKIRLGKEPTADVTVELTATNPGECSVSPESVTLTSENWHTGAEATVTAEPDGIVDGDQITSILTGLSSSADPYYDALNVANVTVTVQNIDAGLAIDSVYPTYGELGLDLDVKIAGVNFDENTVLYMYPDGGTPAVATDATLDSPTQLSATLTDPGIDGSYTLEVSNGTESAIMPSAISFAKPDTIQAQSRKKAIIVAGGGPFLDNDLWLATENLTQAAYIALNTQGYASETIQYVSLNNTLDITGDGQNDVDAPATATDLESAVKTWAEDNTDELILYLTGSGRNSAFQFGSDNDPEFLTPETLDAWLDELQTTMTGRVIVIIDAPESDSFLAPLASPNRIVITGSSATQRVWFLDDGEISFSWPFWEAVYNDGELFAAFDRANDVIGQVQTPSIDADGDGLPDPRNRRAPDDPITLGRGRDVDTDPPAIGKICPDTSLTNGTAYELWAEEVTADNGLSQIWARIFPPVEAFQPGDRPVLVLPTLRLQDLDGDERYAETHDDFTQSGAYKVLIHATDKRDFQSIPKPVRVTQTAGLPFEIGDLNVNGIIDLADVITALKAAAGLSIHDTLHLEPTGDERIGVPDALFLLQKISGKR